MLDVDVLDVDVYNSVIIINSIITVLLAILFDLK